MLHKEFFGIIFLFFVGWIFTASSPTARIENACKPIGFIGSVTTSLSSLVVPSQQATVQKWFDKLEYGCRYITWRLFYQESYNQWLQSQGVTPVTGAEPAKDAAKAAPTGSTAPPQKNAEVEKPAGAAVPAPVAPGTPAAVPVPPAPPVKEGSK